MDVAEVHMISVIVPAHNAEKTIEACLRALQQQTGIEDLAYEIILVNDGSTDNTAVLAKKAGVRVISSQTKKGPASARNAGIRAAKGEITCFTDADCIPRPNWLQEITAPLLANPDIAGCKGAYCCEQTEIIARFVQIEYENKYDILRRHSYITFMDFYSAAYRRQILVENHGFDERFTAANNEDRELSYRLADRGYKMVFQPTALVCHFHANSFTGYVRKKVQNGFWTVPAVRHFPARAKDDSYTPQVQKVQIALIALILLTAAPGLFFPPLLFLAGVLLLIFFMTTIPFTRKAWKKDRTIALFSPFLLAVSALALGIGFAWGWMRPLPPKPEHEDSADPTLSFLSTEHTDFTDFTA